MPFAACTKHQIGFDYEHTHQCPACLREERDALRAFIKELAEGDCAYGDGCPDFAGTRHGTCTPCKARNVLEGR